VNALIFDFDDTILATFESRSSCLMDAASNFGYEISLNDIKTVWGKPFREMILNLLPGIDYQKFYEHYRLVMEKHTPFLKEGASDILTLTKGMNHFVAIVSSSSQVLVLQDLKAVGIAQMVDRVWGQEDCLFHKPDPRVLNPVLDYLQDLNIPKSRCLYIGDSTADYFVAREHRILFLAVTTGRDTANSFLQMGLESQYIHESLTTLLSPGAIYQSFISNSFKLKT